METESNLFDDDLRDREGGKIKCGTAYFNALTVGENSAVYGKFTDANGLLGHENHCMPQSHEGEDMRHQNGFH